MMLMLGRLMTAALMVAGLIAVGGPAANAVECQDGDITPAQNGTYSLCVTGMWVHIDQQLCVDYPQHPYCTGAAATTSSTPPPAAPPPPVVVPPPVIPPPVPYVPYIPPPSAYVPNMGVPAGCTWVDGYTKKNGTRVRGHVRC